jgi:hypothetical protein
VTILECERGLDAPRSPTGSRPHPCQAQQGRRPAAASRADERTRMHATFRDHAAEGRRHAQIALNFTHRHGRPARGRRGLQPVERATASGVPSTGHPYFTRARAQSQIRRKLSARCPGPLLTAVSTWVSNGPMSRATVLRGTTVSCTASAWGCGDFGTLRIHTAAPTRRFPVTGRASRNAVLASAGEIDRARAKCGGLWANRPGAPGWDRRPLLRGRRLG